eukprot:TRINITY_DN33771_c0_g4_i1.p1 TRINITY_DN33771_c0_g4~~TRINITY_DN33771_c0_g4_i1.p1  ORF type:complete len:356 (-),score=52.40 TRINITY_DN33771_c0_g4_i1:238-1305(-)
MTASSGLLNRDAAALRGKFKRRYGASILALSFSAFWLGLKYFASQPKTEDEVDVPVVDSDVLLKLHEEGVPPEDLQGLAVVQAALDATAAEPLSDPLMLLRFYRASEKNVEEAVQMYHSTVRWRQEFSIADIMADYGPGSEYADDGGRATDPSTWSWRWSPSSPVAKMANRHVFFTRLEQRTGRYGAPILFWQVGLADYSGFVREDMVGELVRAFVAHVEDALQASRAASLQHRQLVRAHVIIDAEGFELYTARYFRVLIDVLSICASFFPEVLATITVIRTPWAAKYVYDLAKPFIPQLVQDKLAVFGDNVAEALRVHAGVEPSVLPQYLGGGTSDLELAAAEPVPVGAWRELR